MTDNLIDSENQIPNRTIGGVTLSDDLIFAHSDGSMAYHGNQTDRLVAALSQAHNDNPDTAYESDLIDQYVAFGAVGENILEGFSSRDPEIGDIL